MIPQGVVLVISEKDEGEKDYGKKIERGWIQGVTPEDLGRDIIEEKSEKKVRGGGEGNEEEGASRLKISTRTGADCRWQPGNLEATEFSRAELQLPP